LHSVLFAGETNEAAVGIFTCGCGVGVSPGSPPEQAVKNKLMSVI